MNYTNGRLILNLHQEKIRLEKRHAGAQEEVKALHRFVEALDELYWAGQKIMAEADILRAFDLLHFRTLNAVGATDGSIMVLDDRTDELVFWVVQGQAQFRLTGYRLPSNSGVAGWVVEAGCPVTVENAHQDWRFSMRVDEVFGFETHSILCVPIMDGRQPLGAIEFLNKGNNGSFNEADMTLALVLADVVSKGLIEIQRRSLKVIPQPVLAAA
jgi:GAF domain-containing protein